MDYYEGVGILSVDILKADRIIESTHYYGEKKPHMWWEQIDLNFAFVAYDKNEVHQVYYERIKFCLLTKKIKVDLLANQKSKIESSIAILPITMTYDHALTVL